MMRNNVITLNMIQSIEFDILKFIKDTCDQNNLRYYLAYGTLIGAIRHQGFIPWDDDIDIHMPREDYLKLVKILRTNPHPYYKIISIETTPKFTQILPKMIDSRTLLRQKYGFIERVPLGLFVDIFLLDGAGNTYEDAVETYYAAHKWQVKWIRSVMKAFIPHMKIYLSLLKWIHHIPEKMRGINYWLKQYDRFCAEKRYDDYEYVGALEAGTPEAARNIWKREWFDNGVDVMFNGESFRAPKNYDAVLRPEYGDYMQLPPLEKRVSHHRYDLTILDKSILKDFM